MEDELYYIGQKTSTERDAGMNEEYNCNVTVKIKSRSKNGNHIRT